MFLLKSWPIRATLAFTLLATLTFPATAQEFDIEVAEAPQPTFQWGFSLAFNRQNMDANLSFGHSNRSLILGDSVTNIDYSQRSGFSLGVLMEYNPAKRLALQLRPQLQFASFNQQVTWALEGEEPKQVIETTALRIPVDVRYRFAVGNWQPFVAAGAYYTYSLELPTHDGFSQPGLEFGIGLEKRLNYFAVVPELRYSISSMADYCCISGAHRNVRMEGMRLRMISFALVFKG